MNTGQELFCLETAIHISESIFARRAIHGIELCKQGFTKQFFNNHYDVVPHKVGQVRSEAVSWSSGDCGVWLQRRELAILG